MSKLGEGGMGVVYEAKHQQIGRRAAVKLLHPQFAQDEEYAQRFLNEARAVNLIRHRGLVEIFDYGKLPNGTLFYVMEFLEGGSLQKRILERKAPFQEVEVLQLGVQIARALAAAHESGIVHRDLKPENIMIEADPVNPGQDWVKILDFGISKVRGRQGSLTDSDKTNLATQVGTVMGTPLYMAPEQHWAAEDVDGRADVFSFGVVLYKLLSGQLPFTSNALSLLSIRPPSVHKINPSISRRLSMLVARMISARRDERPTMDEVARQLAALRPVTGRGARLLAVVAGTAGLLIGALLISLLRVEQTASPAELRNRSREVLVKYLRSPDVNLRLMTVRAIGQSRDFGQRTVLELLIKPREQTDRDTIAVTEEAARALGQVGAVDATKSLQALLERKDSPGVQLAAAGALAQLQHPRGLNALRTFLTEGDDLSKVQAALLLLEQRDLSGAPLLWTNVARGRLSEERRIEVLGRLARADDTQARQRLSEDLNRLTNGEARAQVAYTLAQLGEDLGWDTLKKISVQPGPLNEQLLALRLLAGLGDTEQQVRLGELAQDRSQPDSVREQAIAGFGDNPSHASLSLLAAILDERGASARLRIKAAGTLVQIIAGERERIGEQSLNSARAALGSDSLAMRELAVAMLADLESEEAIAPLGAALQDKERAIRRSAVRALAKKNVRAALNALKPALADEDPEVRNLAVRSIGKVLKTLAQAGDPGAVKLVLAQLRHLTNSSSEIDRIIASGVLLKLSEALPSELALLRGGLASKDVQARRLAVEFGESDLLLLTKALSDPDLSVRLMAALRLASQGMREGRVVLRAAVNAGDSAGLDAYVALHNLGEDVPSPPGLASLLTSGDLQVRLHITELLLELPTSDAQRLLRIAMLDPAAVVRRQAVGVATNLYRQTRELGFLRIVRSMRNDPHVSVRSQAVTLAGELDKLPVTGSQPDLGPRPDFSEPADLLVSDPEPDLQAVGELQVDGEEMVRIRIDKNPPQPLNGQPLTLPIGRHRIGYLGGAQEVQVLPEQTVSIRVPVSLVDQLLQDGKEALNHKDLPRAQDYLDRIRRLVQRGKASPSLQADLAYQQARLYEAGNQLDAALTEYNRALTVPLSQRRDELNAALQSTLSRLSAKVGRIQIFIAVEGKCQVGRELLLPPGEQVISLGKGQTRSVYAHVGSVTKVMACQ